MANDTIKFDIKQDSLTKNVTINIYRPYGIDDEWMIVDTFNELSIKELKYLTEFLISVFKKNKK